MVNSGRIILLCYSKICFEYLYNFFGFIMKCKIRKLHSIDTDYRFLRNLAGLMERNISGKELHSFLHRPGTEVGIEGY